MPVDRLCWRHLPFTFSIQARHRWRCPSCDSGSLVVKTETLQFAETRQSRDARHEEDWNPIDYPTIHRFAGILVTNGVSLLQTI